jgi:hypothetical protein
MLTLRYIVVQTLLVTREYTLSTQYRFEDGIIRSELGRKFIWGNVSYDLVA